MALTTRMSISSGNSVSNGRAGAALRTVDDAVPARLPGRSLVDRFRDLVLENQHFGVLEQIIVHLVCGDGEVGSRHDHCAIVAFVVEDRDAHAGPYIVEDRDSRTIHFCPVKSG